MTDCETKRCTRCGDDKPLSAFHRAPTRGYQYVRAECATCRVAGNRLRQYGITVQQYAAMLAAQDDVCAICRKPETALANSGKRLKDLAVDHDAETGRIRGLLCQRCNTGIGKLGHSPDLLRRAAAYCEEQ